MLFRSRSAPTTVTPALTRHALSTLALLWLGLIVGQILLGAATIWSNKAADMATAHVVAGAASLVSGALVTIVTFGFCRAAREAQSPVRERGADVMELEHREQIATVT